MVGGNFFNPFAGGNAGGGGSGPPGKDGVGIRSIEFVSSTGGNTPGIAGATDTYRINYTNGTNTTYVIKNGENGTQGQDGIDGISVTNTVIDANGHLIVTLSDNTVIDAGLSKGEDGEDGDDGEDGISITAATVNSEGHLILTFSNETTVDAGNVKGSAGTTTYSELTDKPTINGVTVQGSLSTSDLQIDAEEVGALPDNTKYGASLSLTVNNDTFVVTGQLKDQDGNNLGSATTIDLPLESMVISGRYDDATQKVILTLKSGDTVEFSIADLIDGLQSEMKILAYGKSTWNDFITAYNNHAVVYCRASSSTSDPSSGAQTRMAFMAYVTDEANPTEVEFQYYRSVNNKNANQQSDQVIVYKLNSSTGWSVQTRNTDVKISAGTGLTSSYGSSTLTLNHADSGVTAGTYRSVTVDAQGHVTGGTNPDLGVGKNTTGTEYTIDGQTVVAQAGAEIFNDYANNKAAGRYSHAEGEGSQALGVNSHAEGSGTQATGTQSHAEGVSTRATGAISHAEGSGTIASGINSHAEGGGTTASGEGSHAEGNSTTASGDYSHAESSNTVASGQYSHAEGRHTIAAGVSQHVQGKFNVQDSNNKYAFIIGNGTSNVNRHNAFAVDWDGKVYVNGAVDGVDVSKGAGKNVTGTEYMIDGQTVVAKDGAEIFNNYEYNQAAGLYSHAEGASTSATGNFSHAEGTNTVASGSSSHAEGASTQAIGAQSHAEGTGASATGDYSHAEGSGSLASGRSSHAEGYGTASGNNSHAEGGGTASGDLSHAEGGGTTASNNSSHAEGYSTTASGVGSHAEGQGTVASGPMSHAEGYGTTASKYASHAEGSDTIASGTISHAEGNGTIASSDSQHAQGKYNIEDANGKYAFIIGNGTNSNNRSNAFAIDWDGKIYVNNSEDGIDLNQLINDEDITGVPPLTVTLQKQQVVTQWEIQGNTEQDGTPTTSNPIPIYGVGDKTNNLCSELVDYVRINIYNGVEEYANDMKATDFIPVDFVTNQYYTPSFVVPTGTTNDTYISGYDANKNYLGRTTGGITSGQPMEFQGSVDTSAVKYVRICANMQTQDVMFNIGNTTLPYEPYGYEIPIVVNENTIIPFYLDFPLYEGDSASFADNGSSFVTRENGVIESYSGETVGNDYVSSTGELSTGAFVVYKLDHPVTTQTTLPDFQLRSGVNTIDVDTDVTPASLYVRWGESNIKTLQFAYVAPNGDDANEGSSANSPFATINHALDLGCNRIFLAGGKYAQTVDLSKARGKHIQIESLTRDSRPVFVDPDCVLVESATLENGVYHATISASISGGNAWIYQDDIPDLETTISDNERMPLQRGKSERCEDTKIERCSSANLQDALDEITSASANVYKWYLDGTTLYFSAPSAPSAQNPICYSPGNGLFSNGDRSISLTINGIKCKYISLNVENLCDVSLTDCQASNIYGWGAIGYSNTLNAKFLRCEASRCYNNGNGDGFNADVSNTGEAFAKHYSATLIDCWSHDNCDDGYSNHRHAESTIIGGLFEYNGKAGLTPSYGEHCSCYNVYSRRNYAGFMCAGETEQAEGGKYTQLICHSCIAESNNRGGYYAGFVVKDNGNRMILIDCKSIGNTNAYYIGQTANAKLIDCTAIGSQTLLDGYPENATVETTVVGRKVEGTTYTVNNADFVAQTGAEVFNIGKVEEGGQVFENNNKATGYFSHAEGFGTTAFGNFSHTEGYNTTASGEQSHAEGSGTTTSLPYAHAEGQETTASGKGAHAEGHKTTASYMYAHAEGSRTTASANASHAEGGYNVASGSQSHAEGYYTTASGVDSHAEGWFTIAAGNYQHVQGKCNVAQGDLNTEMAFIIGNGTSDQNRSNAFAIDWNGKIYQGNTNNGVSLADQQKEIDHAINTGAKNVLKLSLTTQTVDGITFTVNDDQTITITGTLASDATSFPTTIGTVSGLSGNYTLSGCPSGGSGSTYRLYRAGSSASESDIGNGYTYTFEPQNSHAIRIYLYAGNTFNLTFKPMLCPAEITDNTYEPYAPTNRELYETKVSQKEALTAKTTLENVIDLDDIKTAGIYHGVNSAGWNATHMPVANGGFNFSLMVIESGEFIIQIFKQLNGAGDANIYIRRFYIWNTGWDSWYQFTGVPV